jgi:exonuclease III
MDNSNHYVSPTKIDHRGPQAFTLQDVREVRESMASNMSQIGLRPGESKYRVTCWNVNGISRYGAAKARKDLIEAYQEQFLPDILLMQEYQWATKNALNSIKYEVVNREFHYYGVRMQASILYDNAKFSDKKVYNLNVDVGPLIVNGKDRRVMLDDRSIILKLKEKAPGGLEFIVASFHNVYTGLSDSDREQYASEFIRAVLEIAEKEKVPAFIGGDFNVNIKKLEILDTPGCVLPHYQPTNRRKDGTEIDFFVGVRCGSTPFQNVVANQIFPLPNPQNPAHRDLSPFSPEIVTRLLHNAIPADDFHKVTDHDPLFTEICLKRN